MSEETAKKAPIGLFAVTGKWGLLILLIVILIIVPFVFTVMVLFSMSSDKGGGVTAGKPSELAMNQIPEKYMPVYQKAAKKYGVPWNLLAAVHKVETNFSNHPTMVSSVGAEGHMQFMPATWDHYGVDANNDGKADPWNVKDAIFTSARYLGESGAADGNIEQAVFTYNHSTTYVDNVVNTANKYAQIKQQIPNMGGPFAWPVPSTDNMTSQFGNRKDPVTGATSYHGGIDIAAGNVYGMPVIAAAGGKVSYAGAMGGYGKTVIIEHGKGIETLYGHLSALNVEQGQQIKKGKKIAAVGNSGRSTGPHLHFTVKRQGKEVDPMQFLK